MAKITSIANGESGSSTRTKINTAMASVETDATITGDGNVGTALAVVTAQLNAADIKTVYESNLNTNEFNDTEKTLLGTVETGATANSTDAFLLARANHTGTQTLATISDAGTISNKAGDQNLQTTDSPTFAALTTTADITAFNGTAKQFDVAEEVFEAASTGSTSGGEISIGTLTTTYDVALGTGHIVDVSTNTYSSISWGNLLAQVPAGNGVRYILINSGGTITELATAPTPAQRRSNIYLGRIVVSGSVVIQVQNEQVVLEQVCNQLYDFAKALRIFNESGNLITANGANLSINKSVGNLFSVGANFITDHDTPHSVTIPSATLAAFQHITQTASTGVDVTVISPTNYDVGGTITAIGGNNNNATNMRVYLFPSGNIRIAYGQTVYSTLSDAVQGLSSEVFVENPSVAGNGVLIAILAVTKGCTAINVAGTAKILYPSRFGESAVGGAGVSVSSLQNAYDNSATPEITLDSSRGALSIQDNATPIGANLLEVQSNGGGTTHFKVTSSATTVAGNMYVSTMKSGATQAAATASAGELWKTSAHATLPDNVVMIGV